MERLCKMCNWRGTAIVQEKTMQGVTMRFAVCPKCGADLWSETVNNDEE